MTLETQLKIRKNCERQQLVVWEIGASRISKIKREALRLEYDNLNSELKKLDLLNYYTLENFKEYRRLPEYPEGQNPWSKKEQKILDNWYNLK